MIRSSNIPAFRTAPALAPARSILGRLILALIGVAAIAWFVSGILIELV